MTESSTTSSGFAPSWLRSSNHSPTPPFRTVITPSYKDRPSDADWDRLPGERKNQNGFHYQHHQGWNGGDNHNHLNAENYFGQGNNHNRISDYNRDFFRRSNSVGFNPSRPSGNLAADRNGENYPNSHRNHHPGRSKFDSHFRSQVGVKPFTLREPPHHGQNGVSYSAVTTKNVKAPPGPNDPVLQPGDFPSLVPMKAEPPAVKSGQNGIWGNPPHTRGSSKGLRAISLTLSNSDAGGTILGPHYGKGFVMTRDIKDELNSELTGSEDGLSGSDYSKSDHAEPTLGVEEEVRSKSVDVDNAHDVETHSGSDGEEACNWPVNESPHGEELDKSSMLSSSGSTGSVESIDSHQSHISGTTAMMVEDLLDETITEEEKRAIMHALEEIKERTGYGSYYERVALTETRHRNNRYPFLLDGKGEEDDEDPDDRFLK